MRLKPPPEVDEAPGQFWKDFVRETAPEFRKPTIEQLETFILPVWRELVDGARYADARLEEIFGELEPDVIVQDNVVAFPAVPASGRPWVRIVSCNPLELKDPALPPTFSGYPTTDPSRWDEFRARYRELHEPLQSEFSAFCEERGAPPLPGIEFIHESPFLDLSLYPAEADYERSQPLGSTWHRLDSCVRAVDESLRAATRRRSARVRKPRQPRLGRRRPDEPPSGGPRRDAAPLRRQQGPPARADRAGAEHDGRGVPPAACGPPPRRPRDHARREQHGHRVDPLRQADDRASALLGPVRQRAARRGDRLRRTAPTYEFEPKELHRRSTASLPPTIRVCAPLRPGCRRARARSPPPA